MSAKTTLRISEVFYSLQGESKTIGLPTVFIRLTGCPLRCQYCDTEHAFEGGELIELEDLLTTVEGYGCNYITVTGGEPLAQPNCRALLKLLCDKGYQVSLETSGALSIEDIDERVSIVLDIKTPGSRESDRNKYENIPLLKAQDQVKFVICDRTDYEWSKAKMDQLDLQSRVEEILFSPCHGEVIPADLAQWLLDDRLRVRMQLQLHKQIWGAEEGR